MKDVCFYSVRASLVIFNAVSTHLDEWTSADFQVGVAFGFSQHGEKQNDYWCMIISGNCTWGNSYLQDLYDLLLVEVKSWVSYRKQLKCTWFHDGNRIRIHFNTSTYQVLNLLNTDSQIQQLDALGRWLRMWLNFLSRVSCSQVG